MSDNVPFEIQEKIIKTLPIKSLLRFRAVSKTWKSLIDSHDFILHYGNQLHHHHLLAVISDGGGCSGELNYLSISQHDTFPQPKRSLNPPLLVNILKSPKIIGYSHGLLCLKGINPEDHGPTPMPARETAVIWNLSIRKAIAVVLPYVGFGMHMHQTFLGFGVCPVTNDPKLVSFTLKKWLSVFDRKRPSWEVDVFTLSRGVWRTEYSNPRRKPNRVFSSQVVVNGFIYWHAFEAIAHDDEDDDDDEYTEFNVIVSFDLTWDQFGEVKLPDNLAYGHSNEDLSISNLKNSLVVLERDKDEIGFVVWMMEDGAPENFTKLFHILIPYDLVKVKSVLAFWKSGDPVIQISRRIYKPRSSSLLIVYGPHSRQVNKLGIDETPRHVYSYTESLLLLGQPDFIIYDAMMGKRYLLNQTDSDKGLLKHESKGKMKAVEVVKTEPSGNVLIEKRDMMKEFDSKPEEWVESKKKKLELESKD